MLPPLLFPTILHADCFMIRKTTVSALWRWRTTLSMPLFTTSRHLLPLCPHLLSVKCINIKSLYSTTAGMAAEWKSRGLPASTNWIGSPVVEALTHTAARARLRSTTTDVFVDWTMCFCRSMQPPAGSSTRRYSCYRATYRGPRLCFAEADLLEYRVRCVVSSPPHYYKD